MQREGRIFIDEEIKRIEQWSGQLKFKVIEEIKKQSHRQTHGKSFVVNRNNQLVNDEEEATRWSQSRSQLEAQNIYVS